MTNDSIDKALLLRLIPPSETFISAEQLAKELSLSQASIWKHLEQLEKEGVIFEAVQKKGYRLIQEPNTLHPVLLKAYLEKEGIHQALYFREAIDSTNTEGLRLLNNAAEAPGLVLAKTMTAGRGRLGRQWRADDPGNLYFSFIFRPDAPIATLSRLPLWIGLCVCDAFEKIWGICLSLKWPNDLLFEGKKLAGMLAESTLDIDRIRQLVFGIGLNVNTSMKEWPEEWTRKISSLAQAKGTDLPLHKVATLLAKTVFIAYEKFIKNEYQALFNPLWERYNHLAGQNVEVFSSQPTLVGKVLGLGPQGELLIQGQNHQVIAVHSGEVSLSPSSFSKKRH